MSRPYADLDDADLIALCRGGRTDAFAALVTRHKAAVYGLAAHRLRDPDEALDVTQDVFVSAYGALPRFDTARPLGAWLARIAINKCRDRHRRRKVRGWLARVLPIDHAGDIPDPATDPVGDAETRDRLARTRAAIDALPASLREPLLLCAVDGMAQAEAAEILGLSAKAVELRLRRARAALAAQNVQR